MEFSDNVSTINNYLPLIIYAVYVIGNLIISIFQSYNEPIIQENWINYAIYIAITIVGVQSQL